MCLAKNLRGFFLKKKIIIGVKNAKMKTSLVEINSRFLAAIPIQSIFFFSKISYKHNDMHFLAPPPIKRRRRSLNETNTVKQI